MKRIQFLILTFFIVFGGLVSAEEAMSEQNSFVIVMLGPPGSGKGTLSGKLSQEYGIPHISTGDLFRENIKGNTALGQKARSYMDKGALVPDQLVLDMLFDRVDQGDCDLAFILDGFPRTIPQAEALGAFLEEKGKKLLVVDLQVTDEEVVRRLTSRLICSDCGQPYSTLVLKPKVDGVCDECGGTLKHRKDDEPAVVEDRLGVYNRQTLPLIEFYQDKQTLNPIHGQGSPEKVLQDTIALVDSFQEQLTKGSA